MAENDAAPGAAPGEGRAPFLDLKTLLVGGMISAHVIQLIREEPSRAAWVWSDFINLVTFSGFLLAFGLGMGGPQSLGRLRPVLAILPAVRVSPSVSSCWRSGSRWTAS